MSPLYDQALAAQEQGQHEHAEQLFLKVLGQAQNAEDVEQQQRCLVQLCALAKARKDMHSAFRWLKKNYNITKKYNTRQAARICLEIAVVGYQSKELEETKIWARKALERGEENWNRDVMAESQLLLGMVFLIENRPEDARIFFRRSNLIFEELKDEDGIYKSLFHMGLVHHQLGDFSKARSNFLQCLERAHEEDVSLIANLYFRLTFISMEMELYIDALFYALAALGRYRRMQSNHVDRVWKEIFRIREYLSAEEFALQVRSHLNEEGYKKFVAMSEAVAMRFEKENIISETPTEKPSSIGTEKQSPKADDTTVPMNRDTAQSPIFDDISTDVTPKTSPSDSDTAPSKVDNPPSAEVFVDSDEDEIKPPTCIEIEVFPEEPQEEDSTDNEMTWREDGMEPDKSQTPQIIMLFFAVFVFVFGSLYLIQVLQ